MGSKKNAAKHAPKTHKKNAVDSQPLDANDPLPRPVPHYVPPDVPLPINPPPKRVRFQSHNDNNASESIQPRTTRTQALATTHLHPDTSQEAEDPSSSIPNRILPKQKRTAAIKAAVAWPAIIANELLDSDASVTIEQDDLPSVVQQIGSAEDNYHPPDGDDDYHSKPSYLSEPLTPPPPPPLPLLKAIITRPRDISTSQKAIAAPTVTTRNESICMSCIL